MEPEEFDILLPEELKGQPYMVAGIARMFIKLLKESSKRFELGEMTKDEARALVSFAYIPIRHMVGDTTWQNPGVDSPHQWSYWDYYEALGKLANSDNNTSLTTS